MAITLAAIMKFRRQQLRQQIERERHLNNPLLARIYGRSEQQQRQEDDAFWDAVLRCLDDEERNAE